MTKNNPDVKSVVFGEIDSRNPRKKKVTFRDVAVLHGERPQQLQHLCPYEFVTYWEAALCKYPSTLDAPESEFHAELTELGKTKLQDARELRAM